MAASRPRHRRPPRFRRARSLVLVAGALAVAYASLVVTAADQAAGTGTGDPVLDPVHDPAAGPDGVCAAFMAGTWFEDVPVSSAHAESIACVAQHGIAPADLDGSFRPGSSVQRDELAIFIVRALATAGHPLPTADAPFTDIAGTHGEDAIAQLAAAGIVNGRTSTTYDPEGIVTRAQMASYLVGAAEWVHGTSLHEPAPSPFTDIAASTHQRSIDAAYALELTVGRTATSYDPDAPVRRDQAATFMLGLVELLDR